MPAIKTILRLLLALLTLAAIGSQWVIHLQLGANRVNFISYFTNLANLVAAAVLLVTARPRATAGAFDRLRSFSVINMTVVGIVFWVLLRNADLGPLLPWVNFVLHYLMPCAVVLDWVLEPPSIWLGAKDLGRCLIFPAAYLAYTLVRGAQVGWYPYPFLNPDRVGGYGGVVGYGVGITVLFLMVGGLLLFIGNRLGRNRQPLPR
jgi:hypothetical protein